MRALVAAALAACVLFSPLVAAQWAGVFKGGPMEFFDEDDMRLFLDASRQALGRPADDQVLGWENPKNGHRGDVKVLRAFESRGRDCKELQVRGEAQGRKGDTRLNYCSIDGQWKLLGDSQL